MHRLSHFFKFSSEPAVSPLEASRPLVAAVAVAAGGVGAESPKTSTRNAAELPEAAGAEG